MKSIYRTKYKVLIKWLTYKRQMSGVTQARLAECLGKPQSYVSKYENGDKRLDMLEIIEICEQVFADPHELLDLLIKPEVK